MPHDPKKTATRKKPGVCIPWEEKKKELPKITSKEELVRKAWEDTDSLAYTFSWQLLLSS